MNTGLYLALLEPAGDLFVAVNDMEAVESITPIDIESLSDVIAESDLIVVDANLRPDTLKAAAQIAGGIPLMADTVSASKAGRLTEILPMLELLKTNRAEAEVLTGFPLNTEAALREGCGKLLGSGLRQLYITLGAQGACCASKDGVYFQNTLPAKLVNVNGAGDAFAAGAAYSYCRGNTTEANGIFAAACAAITLECDDGVCKTLTREAAEKRAGILRTRTDFK
jgi:pseudouridine kinase